MKQAQMTISEARKAGFNHFFLASEPMSEENSYGLSQYEELLSEGDLDGQIAYLYAINPVITGITADEFKEVVSNKLKGYSYITDEQRNNILELIDFHKSADLITEGIFLVLSPVLLNTFIELVPDDTQH